MKIKLKRRYLEKGNWKIRATRVESEEKERKKEGEANQYFLPYPPPSEE